MALGMSERTFEIFRTEEDRVNWDKYIEHVDVIEQLTDEEKERGKEAFLYLRQPEVLGEKFLGHAHATGHPLFRTFRNTVPWTRKWLTRFAEAMKSLQTADGFSTCMKEEIKDAGKYKEREYVLEVAYKLFNAGFEISFDPAVTVPKPRGFTGRLIPIETVPDLKIIDRETREEIFVEVSAMGESDPSKQSERTYHTVFNVLVSYALHELYLFPRARIHRILDDDELNELVPKLFELINEVKSSGKVCYLISDEIEACLAPANEQDFPSQWAAERGITGRPIEGPLIPLRDPLRMKRIIRKEQKQLPPNKPGIVVITTDWSLLFHAHGLRTIMDEAEEAVREFPKLACAVVSCSYQGGDEEGHLFAEGGHTIIKRITNEKLIEQTIITLNPSSSFQMPASTFDRVRLAFIQG